MNGEQSLVYFMKSIHETAVQISFIRPPRFGNHPIETVHIKTVQFEFTSESKSLAEKYLPIYWSIFPFKIRFRKILLCFWSKASENWSQKLNFEKIYGFNTSLKKLMTKIKFC